MIRGVVALMLVSAGLNIHAGAWIDDCEAKAELTPVCQFNSPEDIEPVPDTKSLIVSQFGGFDGKPGSLVAYNTETDEVRELFPLNAVAGVGNWGEKACKFPGAGFSPHGIHLSRRPSGRLQLLVVNHSGRESVEFFEVLTDQGNVNLSWRGCVEMPEPAFLNDVVALPELGFLVTHMFAKNNEAAMKRAMAGRGSGFVYQWYPRVGVLKMAGTYGAMPNGIQISKDGKYVYLNLYTGGGVRKIERSTGRALGRAFMPKPDNSAWLPDGRLLVASHTGKMDDANACLAAAGSGKAGACGLSFKLVAVDPQTMRQETILEQSGAPMGAGTIAVVQGETLYIGAFAGNRILKTTWNK